MDGYGNAGAVVCVVNVCECIHTLVYTGCLCCVGWCDMCVHVRGWLCTEFGALVICLYARILCVSVLCDYGVCHL